VCNPCEWCIISVGKWRWGLLVRAIDFWSCLAAGNADDKWGCNLSGHCTFWWHCPSVRFPSPVLLLGILSASWSFRDSPGHSLKFGGLGQEVHKLQYISSEANWAAAINIDLRLWMCIIRRWYIQNHSMMRQSWRKLGIVWLKFNTIYRSIIFANHSESTRLIKFLSKLNFMWKQLICDWSQIPAKYINTKHTTWLQTPPDTTTRKHSDVCFAFENCLLGCTAV
jgi:hypothetical protein